MRRTSATCGRLKNHLSLPASEFLECRRLLSDTFSISQVSSLPNSYTEYGPTHLTPYGSDLLFQATNPVTGTLGIWRSDGTAAGTYEIPISKTGNQLLVGTQGNTMFFAVSPYSAPIYPYPPPQGYEQQPSELFATTDQGKTLTDLGPLPAGIETSATLVFNGKFYFTNASSLWVSDGTSAGTKIVSENAADDPLVGLNNLIFFQNTKSGLESLDLATSKQTQISSGPPASLTLFNDSVYFLQNGSLWKTDGQVETVVAPAASSPILQSFAVDGNRLIFNAQPNAQPDGPAGIYALNPQTNTIDLVTAVPGTPFYNYPNALLFSKFDNQLLFVDQQVQVIDSTTSLTYSLWKTDGTASGTSEVEMLNDDLTLLPVDGTIFASSSEQVDAFHGVVHGNIGPGQVFVLGTTAAASRPNAELAAAITRIGIRPVAEVGDSFTAVVRITNSGTTSAFGSVNIQFSTTLASDPITAELPVDVNDLRPGRSKSFLFHLTVEQTIPIGTQSLVATLSQGQDNSTATATTTVDTKPVTKRLYTRISYSLGGTNHRSLILTAPNGLSVKFSLSGPGMIQVGLMFSTGFSVNATGTARSTLSITPLMPGTLPAIESLVVTGDLRQILMSEIAIAGAQVSFGGNFSQISLGNVSNSLVYFSGPAVTTITALNIFKSSFYPSSQPLSIHTFSAESWTGGTAAGQLLATNIDLLKVSGEMNANVAAANIGSTEIGLMSQGNWYISGNIQHLIANAIVNSEILAGITTGYNTNAGLGNDTFSAAVIGSINVLGAVTDSLIAAGLSVAKDKFPPVGNQKVLAGSSIGEISIGGTLDSNSRIVAQALPDIASIQSALVDTAFDKRFSAGNIPQPLYNWTDPP